MKKLALSLVRFCMTSQPTATPVHGYLFSQMFVMAVDYHCKAVVCDGSSFQRAHKLQGKQNGLTNLDKFRAKTASGNYCNPFMSDNNAGNIRERLHVVNSTRMAAKCTKMKTARAKRAKQLFLILKYANLYLSSLISLTLSRPQN